jgi:hypothetical protein
MSVLRLSITTIVLSELKAKFLIYALIEKNAHSAMGEQLFPGFFDDQDSHFPVHRRKTLQKAFQPVSGLNVVEKSLNEDPRSPERGLSGHDFRVSNDN